MKKIKLTQGKYTLVDDEKFEYLNQFKWHFDGRYAAIKNNKKLYMHRLIMGSNVLDIDHIDRNKLNNQKNNLRFIRRSENVRNKYFFNKTGCKGVAKVGNKYKARIMMNYEEIYLGIYSTLEEAGKAYLKAHSRLLEEDWD